MEQVKRRPTTRRPKVSTFSRMRALLFKDLLILIRNVAGLPLLFIFPLTQVVLFFTGIGGDIYGLSFGIVNDELANCKEMIGDIRKASGVKFYGDDEDDNYCHYVGLSCLLIDTLGNDEKTLTIIHYADQETALAAAKATANQGTLYIPGNFSAMLEQRYRANKDADNDTIENSEVKVWLDMSDYMIGYQLKKFLYDRYADFSNILADGCGDSRKTLQAPLRFANPIPGAKNRTWIESIAACAVLLIAFFLAAISASAATSSERESGTWDRNLLAGASVTEILLSHVMCQMVIMVIQVAEILFMTFVVFGLENNGSLGAVIFIVCLQSIGGIAYGLFISSITKTITASMVLVLGTFMPYCFISGFIWPVQGMVPALRYFSYLCSTTLPTLSLDNVLDKGHGLLHGAVWPGVAVSVAWAVLPFMAAVFLLHRK